MPRICPIHRARCGFVPLLTSLLVGQAAAQEASAEAKLAAVHTAMLLKIASYIAQDPPPADTPPRPQYRIGLLGDDATTAAAKKTLPGKKVGTGAAVVVQVGMEDAKAGRATEQCDLLYIATPIDDESLATVVANYAKKPLILVCHRPGFAAGGGTVQLFVHDGGLRFEVNHEAMRKQQLGSSAQFLKHSLKGPRR